MAAAAASAPGSRQIAWLASIPVFVIHFGWLAVFWTGVSWPAVIAAVAVYWIQIFGVSAGYHRYFAHRTFRTSRAFQFVLGWLGATSAQMGPLWWSSFHRRHHAHTDQPGDVHSPRQSGFWWAHMGWILERANLKSDPRFVRDWAEVPEIRWLDSVRWLPPLSAIVTLALLGAVLQRTRPEWGASPAQMVVWGFFVATVVCHHVTFCVNSLAHIVGRRRFDTPDDSRNLWWLAILTNGEGWHNNHHRFPASERHGHRWWEWDPTHYILRGLEKLGVVRDIRTPPAPLAGC
jgi:stearoyl-CoA desaturase (delta-9 desaturase)